MARAVAIRAEARALPLPDDCVDLVMTSPPYFGLRQYTDGGEPLAGQVGGEPTPREYLDSLLACTAEWMRVLKPGGSIFVNLADKYSQRTQTRRSSHQPGFFPGRFEEFGESWAERAAQGHVRMPHQNVAGDGDGYVPEKSLMALPWRYAIRCVDDLGLILRRDIIWCLSGGARLYARTKSGDRPIMLRDLVRAYRPEDVQLWNGERWTQALGWNRSPDRDGALELELRTGERIGCTAGHRWPTQRGVIRADEIRIGDVIQTTRLPGPDFPAAPSALDDDDIGWLVGLYMAEGSRSEKTLQFAGHVREELRHARLSRIAASYHGGCAVYRTSENGVTCNLNGTVLLGIIDHYIGRGRTSRSKRLRKAVWQRSDAFLASIMDGYLSGDGHYDAKNGRWRLGFTANDEWAADLRTLAARLGAKISLRRHDHKFNGRIFPGWRGEWRWARSVYHTAKQDGEIVAVRASRAREFYDVGVADDPHLFALASGVLTHNSKPNGMPESVTDRCRSSHEYLFHLVKSPRYYSAVDEIREPHVRDWGSGPHGGNTYRKMRKPGEKDWNLAESSPNPLGKLPGSVWEIATEPLNLPGWLGIEHYAAFPTALPRKVILGWSPPGICMACGQGRFPVTVSADREPNDRLSLATRARTSSATGTHVGSTLGYPASTAERKIAGYACACTPYTDYPERRRPTVTPGRALGRGHQDNDVRADAAGTRHHGNDWPERLPVREYHFDRWTPPPTRPALVIDPFGGTGTTALVAVALGRDGISFDLSGDYSRAARWRTRDSGERAKARGEAKPPPAKRLREDLYGDLADELDALLEESS